METHTAAAVPPIAGVAVGRVHALVIVGTHPQGAGALLLAQRGHATKPRLAPVVGTWTVHAVIATLALPEQQPLVRTST